MYKAPYNAKGLFVMKFGEGCGIARGFRSSSSLNNGLAKVYTKDLTMREKFPVPFLSKSVFGWGVRESAIKISVTDRSHFN